MKYLKRLYHSFADPVWDGQYGTYEGAVWTCRGKSVHDERYVRKAVQGLDVLPTLTDGWRWIFDQLPDKGPLKVADIGSGAGTFRRLARQVHVGYVSVHAYDTIAMREALSITGEPFLPTAHWIDILTYEPYDAVLCHNALQFFEQPDEMLVTISNLKTKQVILADIPTSDYVTPYVTVWRWPWWKVNAVDLPMWVLPKQRLVRDLRRLWPGWTMAHKEINQRQYWSLVKP